MTDEYDTEVGQVEGAHMGTSTRVKGAVGASVYFLSPEQALQLIL